MVLQMVQKAVRVETSLRGGDTEKLSGAGRVRVEGEGEELSREELRRAEETEVQKGQGLHLCANTLGPCFCAFAGHAGM